MSPALEKLFLFWINQLRLRDWKLDVKQGTEEQGFDDPTIYAKVHFSAEVREGTVYLRRLDKPDQGLEEDLVHELLHLVFISASYAAREKDDIDQLPLEQAINVTSEVLVALRRRSAAK